MFQVSAQTVTRTRDLLLRSSLRGQDRPKIVPWSVENDLRVPLTLEGPTWTTGGQAVGPDAVAAGYDGDPISKVAAGVG